MVEIPAMEADRPSWGRVGIIAAVGFAIGIAWPHVTGTRVAPSPPVDSPPTAAAVAPSESALAASASPLPGSSSPVAAGSSAPVAASGNVTVSKGSILRCRDGKEEITDACGSLQFDPVAVPRLKELARCPGANGFAGKLSVGFEIDFRHKAIQVLRGKSTTLTGAPSDAVMKCVRAGFANVTFDDVPHEHRRYAIFYSATFTPAGKPLDTSAEPALPEGSTAGSTTNETPASGTATVGWDVAIARDAPKTGAVTGRILRGTKVKILGHQNEWYHVQYPTDHDGWVYRGAIGL
jgi:hypothetical protein